jgi:S1-C subfamily serine protease/photosystem II stability/assembly factor-like uncharacterized protein
MRALNAGSVGHGVGRWWVGCSVLVIVCSALAQQQPKATSRPAATSAPAREERLARVEAQLAELQKTIADLRKAPGETATAVSNPAQPTPAPLSEAGITLDSKWLSALSWRSIGPAGMGGRIVDLAVYEADPSTYWVATASGGLLKTTNNGITFAHQFDNMPTVSIGAAAVAPSDSNVVWVGTGENNPRNSVSYGDGVYKSTDGGKTWKNMGLKSSFQVGHIVIHRTNPNIVYVGALGRLYGTNEERGLYKTINGGETWERVLYVDDKTGVIDVQMHPTDSDTLIAAMWERQRDGYDSHPGAPMQEGYDSYDPIKKWGPGSGLFKTTDGGKSWKKLTKGLPSSQLGRMGIDYYRKDPNTVFVIVDCAKIGMGLPPRSGAGVYVDIFGEDIEGGGGVKLQAVRDNGPAAKAGLQVDDIVQSIDGKPITKAEQLSDEIREHKVGDKLKFKVLRGDKTVEITVTLERPPESPGSSAGNVYMGIAGEDGESGVKVTAVAAGSPAVAAGLEAEDVIQAVEGKTVASYNQLLEEVRGKKAGDVIKLKVMRDNQTREVELTLADRPQGQGQGRGGGGGRGGPPQATAPYMGVLGEDAEGGVRLTRVVEGGPAEKAGLKSGDVVQVIGDKEVKEYQEMLEEIRERKVGDKVKIKLTREGKSQQVEVALAERPRTGPGASSRPAATRPSTAMYGGQMENVQDEQGPNGFEYGGIYKSTDGGETWKRINSLNPRPMYFSLLRVDPSDDKYLYVGGISMYRSKDGGKTFKADASRGVHADQHVLWINPKDGRHMIVGCDGGFYLTHDRAENWDHLNTMAIAQFYHIAICPHQPYRVAGGLQDNGSWCGPSISLSGTGPINEDWVSVGGGDGFVCRVDPEDPDLVYGESQNGSMFRRNLRTGERAFIRPQRADGAPAYRFNWNTPFILSAHNPRIFYAGGNYVFRSLDRGNNLQAISPEITTTKWGSATAICESPRNPNVLYAGTDDGALWVTKDGGKNWANVTANVGLPGLRWVSSIEASRFAEGRAYVVFDGHRSDDDDPYVYVTEDFGKTWKSIRSNLGWGSTRVLREDIQNANVLYVGTEFGAWCSIDRGKMWNKLGSNLPTVAVHEFALHPASGEIVAGTHGRSLWVLDVSALRQIKPENLASKPALYEPPAVIRWRREPVRSGTNRRFVGSNPPRGAQIYYSLPQNVQKASVKIVDISGQTLREFPAKKEPGLHRITWDLRAAPSRATTPTTRPTREGERGGEGGARTAFAGRGGGGGGGGGGPRGTVTAAAVTPGAYRILLNIDDGQPIAQTLRVEADPVVADSVMADEEEESEEEEEEREMREAAGELESDREDEGDEDRDREDKEIREKEIG